ncbi:hypothetical protein [Erythrobacter sp.]|uniref:hypothetical protein n=1 Tax=Erythrobacter sp. TaxID=1042 RepID=UPI001425DDCB|nr:hypothetical protein [Erythrobacter sp.]QIQ86276.1 MAG: hypothetical protein G9473_05935 [Erythrobacter sp.]
MEPNPRGPHIGREERLRILFYLPATTPWWFENIIHHVIARCSEEHEVHVMVPPLWRGTGLDARHIPLLAALPEVRWHVLDGPDHPVLRSDASGIGELLELVNFIAPDLTLCRSADTATPALYPGHVRFIPRTRACSPDMPMNCTTCWHGRIRFRLVRTSSPGMASRTQSA